MKKTKSATTWMLMAEFETPVIELKDCLHHLDYETIGEANRAARTGKLPLPVFRTSKSKRGSYKVHLEDLANMIDKQREKAMNSWNTLNDTTPPQEEEPPRQARKIVA